MQGKRIMRRRDDRLLAGVASGLGAYVNIDPMLVRIGFVLLSFVNGVGIILYLILWLLLPNEDTSATNPRGQVQENIDEMQHAARDFVERLRHAIEQIVDQVRGSVRQ